MGKPISNLIELTTPDLIYDPLPIVDVSESNIENRTKKVYIKNIINKLSGDLTVSDTGTVTIGNEKITSAKLANDAVETANIKDSNVTNAKLATGIDVTKLADGSISNTEFQYLNGVTSNIQTQLTNEHLRLVAIENELPSGGIDGEIVGTDNTQTLENKTIDLSDNNVINQIPVTYAQLTALIAANDGAGALKKGNKYLITDFQETWNGGSKEVEQIVVTASSPNTLERVAASVTNPSDYIEYTIENTLITGATKGVILKRIDSNRNEFGYGFNNSFGIYCNLNTFGNDCYSNTFENECYLNTFGNNCKLNTFGNNCKNNIFCDNIQNIDFTSSTYSTWQTHLQADYKCKVFKLPNGSLCLEYVNSDGQTVMLVAE